MTKTTIDARCWYDKGWHGCGIYHVPLTLPDREDLLLVVRVNANMATTGQFISLETFNPHGLRWTELCGIPKQHAAFSRVPQGADDDGALEAFDRDVTTLLDVAAKILGGEPA